MVQRCPQQSRVQDECHGQMRGQSILGHARDVALCVKSVLEARLDHVPPEQTLVKEVLELVTDATGAF